MLKISFVEFQRYFNLQLQQFTEVDYLNLIMEFLFSYVFAHRRPVFQK